MTKLEDLIKAAVRWNEAWDEAWDDNGEPVDGWDDIHYLEDDAVAIVQALAGTVADNATITT